jgi:stage V sporulation protein AC
VSKPKLTPKQQKYQNKAKKTEPKPHYLKNVSFAFISGGLICMLGQAFIDFYSAIMNIPLNEAANPATATMILIGSLLTGFGVFDKLAKYAGAGIAVPVTGFANSVVSSALEFREEGLVYGVCAKMFTLAGAVITFGVMTAFIFGLIHAIFH